MTGAPNPHCEIYIDGQLAIQQDGENWRGLPAVALVIR